MKTLTALLLVLLPFFAGAVASAETIQGRWQLIEAVDLRPDGTVARHPWGRKPIGAFVAEGGSCYLQIMSSDVPWFRPDRSASTTR